MQSDWTTVCATGEFPDDGKFTARVGQWQVLVVRVEDEFFAYNDCCPHQAARLSEGRIRRGSLMCPLHGARFEISSGRCLGGSYPPLLMIPVRERDGVIEVNVPARNPGPGEMAA